MGSWNKICVDCGIKCNGQRCKKCFVKSYKPNKNQLEALDTYGKKFELDNNLSINNTDTQFKKGKPSWNKGITGEDSHMFKGEK